MLRTFRLGETIEAKVCKETYIFLIIISSLLFVRDIHAGVEKVYVAKIMGNDDKAIIVRTNSEAYLIETGIGCISLWRYEGKEVFIISPGLFLGVGSKLLIPENSQECRIWNSVELGTWSNPPLYPLSGSYLTRRYRTQGEKLEELGSMIGNLIRRLRRRSQMKALGISKTKKPYKVKQETSDTRSTKPAVSKQDPEKIQQALEIGTSKDTVRLVLGEPIEIRKTGQKTGSWEREYWYYTDNKKIEFKDDKVVSVQDPDNIQSVLKKGTPKDTIRKVLGEPIRIRTVGPLGRTVWEYWYYSDDQKIEFKDDTVTSWEGF